MRVPSPGAVASSLGSRLPLDALAGPAGAALRTGLELLGRRRLPRTRGRLDIAGLAGPVEVIRDQFGVAHVYAGDERDLFLAQGFVHAQDRLFAMDLARRVAIGRVSELVGPHALDTDRLVRTLGFARLGARDLDDLDDDGRDAVEAYADGVNAFLESPSSSLPLEFTLLRSEPALWEPSDSLAISRMMAWQNSVGWYGELIRARTIEAVGAEHAAEIDVGLPDGAPPTLPRGIEFATLASDGRLQAAHGPYLRAGGASNAWAVAGSRTTTGAPLLCNDPHLALATPSLWYQAHLVSGRYEVAGVSVPGIPGIVIGHNARIAWGITLAQSDTSDLFVERFVRRTKKRYEHAGEIREADLIREEIGVRGHDEPHVEEVVVTHHGPIVSGVVGEDGQRLALCSMALRKPNSLPGFLALNRAAGWDEFVDAMRRMEATPLNVAYADTDGNIGYWNAGAVPIRGSGDGSVPAPGWSGEHDWTGEIPFEEMPHALNPQDGLVVTANHRIVPDDYPHELGRGCSNGYRAQRIHARLEAAEQIGPDLCREVQLDVVSIPGARFAELIQAATLADPDAALARDLLIGFDGTMHADSTHACVYAVARLELLRLLLEPGLGPELALGVLGSGPSPALMHLSEWHGHDAALLLRMLETPGSWWVLGAGGMQQWLERGLGDAVRWLRERLGPDATRWRWGAIHRATFPHALGTQGPLDRVFQPPPVPMGGDTDTPMQTAVVPQAPYDVTGWSTNYRQVIDLGDLSRSHAIFAPGQSGNLASSHYHDFVGPWHRGELHPMLWTREQVELEADARLLLGPKG